MSLVFETRSDASFGIGLSDTPDGLARIRRPDCPAVIWRRQPAQSFQTWIDALSPEVLPRTRVILRPDAVDHAMSAVCDASGTPECAERRRLVDDITAQAEIFAGLMRAPDLLLRLDVVSSNACRKFHVDAITARLVCTYRGTGTQYGVSDGSSDPDSISTVPTGSSILLRGTLWPTAPDTGFLHRSPPIEGTGETRLVLVLDPILDPEEEI